MYTTLHYTTLHYVTFPPVTAAVHVLFPARR